MLFLWVCTLNTYIGHTEELLNWTQPHWRLQIFNMLMNRFFVKELITNLLTIKNPVLQFRLWCVYYKTVMNKCRFILLPGLKDKITEREREIMCDHVCVSLRLMYGHPCSCKSEHIIWIFCSLIVLEFGTRHPCWCSLHSQHALNQVWHIFTEIYLLRTPFIAHEGSKCCVSFVEASSCEVANCNQPLTPPLLTIETTVLFMVVRRTYGIDQG